MDVGYQTDVSTKKKWGKKVTHFKGKIPKVWVDLIWSLAIEGIDNQYRKAVWALSEKSLLFPCCQERKIKVQTFVSRETRK